MQNLKTNNYNWKLTSTTAKGSPNSGYIKEVLVLHAKGALCEKSRCITRLDTTVLALECNLNVCYIISRKKDATQLSLFS